MSGLFGCGVVKMLAQGIKMQLPLPILSIRDVSPTPSFSVTPAPKITNQLVLIEISIS